MRRNLRWMAIGTTAALLAGCATFSVPEVDNPLVVVPDPNVAVENPVFVPHSPEAYGQVFEKVIDVVNDYFEISYSNRYDGRVETFPQLAPGFEQFWKPGNPNLRDRLEATLQSIQNRAVVLIQPTSDGGGYFIHVSVFKELEDLPQPLKATSGGAAFRTATTVERQFEVIDPTVIDSHWVPLGHNVHLEQLLLQRLKNCL